MITTFDIMNNARKVRTALFNVSEEVKNNALLNMADCLLKNKDEILLANKEDVLNAKGKLSDVMIDRLFLDANRIKAMAEGIKEVAKLKDPCGRIINSETRPNGLLINKVSVPIGVVAIIFESRPNVTSDAAALCLKSGNVCILRSGKDAYYSSQMIVKALREGLLKSNLNPDIIQLVEDTSRQSSVDLMEGVGYIDLLIPRGGAGLIKAVKENAKVPCIQTGTGICHIYVDETADFDMALSIIENAKTSRPSVCNAAEVLLVNKNIANEFLPLLKKRLVDLRCENKVELRLCEESFKIIDGKKAEEKDFDTEFLDYILAVKIVDDTIKAAEHILNHSTGHSEAIITKNKENADLFTSLIDSAAVYVNASTRFTDGGEFGLGCEMGISTQKLHARGPMGLSELNTYKYVILGNGQVR